MKKSHIIIFILFLLIQIGKSQTVERKLAVGFSISKNLYVGDYGGNGIFDFGHTEFTQGYLSGGLSLGLYISPAIELGIQANYGDYGYWNTDDFTNQYIKPIYGDVGVPCSFLAMKYQATTSIKYKFHLINEDDHFVPFITVGMGVAGYARNTVKDHGTYPRLDDKGIDLIVPFGAGFKYMFSDKIAIQYEYHYNITNSDIHDTHVSNVLGNPDGDFEHNKPGNDAFGEHVFSIIYTFDIDPTFDRYNPWRTTKYKGYKKASWKNYKYRQY